LTSRSLIAHNTIDIFKQLGSPTSTATELKVQRWFYIFQVTQVFLVTAVFSSSATVVSQLVGGLKDPSSIPQLLAQQLPKSSNFYLTYFIIQGTTSAADNLLNYSDLLEYLFYDRFIDKTPRAKLARYTSMKGIAWGKVFPKVSRRCSVHTLSMHLLTQVASLPIFASSVSLPGLISMRSDLLTYCLAIAYSCISPLVMGFAAIGLSLYYFSYRYNLLFVIQSKVDTKGQAYTQALQHLLTGVYIGELAMIGLFALGSANGPLVLTAVLFVVTILYNILTNKYLKPLETSLPTDIASAADEEDGDEASTEATPLLSSVEEGDAQSQQPLSRIQRAGQSAHIPPRVLDPLARFFEPHVFASYKTMKAWLREGASARSQDEPPPKPMSDAEAGKAYLNPALTSPTPLVWLAQDALGASKHEIAELERLGLRASEQAAWLDDKGRLRLDVDGSTSAPI
jgi:calcium permeable stress-gated cation channel